MLPKLAPGLLVLALSHALSAQVPDKISVQGCLTDAAGQPVSDDTYSVSFSLYDAAVSGTLKWSETRDVTTGACVYSALLGTTTPLALPFNEPLWLGVGLEGEAEMTPRIPLASAPYALGLRGVRVMPAESGSTSGTTIVAGSTQNAATGAGATVGGGGGVAGGSSEGNTADGNFSVVGGGSKNLASGDWTVVSGGRDNKATYLQATVGGGWKNQASGPGSTVGGGWQNSAGSGWSAATVSGGQENAALYEYATVGGGFSNVANGLGATVSGGAPSNAADPATRNRVSDNWGTIGGGGGNRAGLDDGMENQEFATVAGGNNNTAGATAATVGGGYTNTAGGGAAVIAGGHDNTADGGSAAIGGGRNNVAGGLEAVIAGGASNSASVQGAAIGGGTGNAVSGPFGAIGGGSSNAAAGSAAVAGGNGNAASGPWSSVGGGSGNTAGGNYAMIPGGRDNLANGSYSFAGGRRARTSASGAFVWADATDADFPVATAGGQSFANQFLVRAYGGMRLSRGRSAVSNTSAALQVEQADLAEAAWMRQTSSVAGANGPAVAALLKPSSSGNAFLRGYTQDSDNGTASLKFQINSGGTLVTGSDLAEALPVADARDTYEPGDVLVISRESPGAVERSTRPYDPAVIGVYSTRPGVLGADKDGATEVGPNDIPVAIAGVVPVKASAENGPIHPGDLLTTSGTPGHVMRATPIERDGHAQIPAGAVIGKALGRLESGTGEIRMFVMCQ